MRIVDLISSLVMAGWASQPRSGEGGLSDPAAPRNDHCFAFSVCLPAVFAITRWLRRQLHELFVAGL